MYAVEFRTRIKDGTIEIPSQYRDRLTDEVKVILLADIEEQTNNLIDQLLETPAKVNGFRPLSREEVHDNC